MKRIKILTSSLEIITVIIVFISLFFLLISFIEYHHYYNQYASFFKATYLILKQYSGLYYASIILITAYCAIRQLNQLKLTQQDIESRREKEKKEETIKQCQYFMENIQTSIRDLIQNGELISMPIKYKVKDFFSDEIKQNHVSFYNSLKSKGIKYRSDIVLTLNKIESFANYMLYGNIDNELGKKLTGDLYCKQIDLLAGMISFYRHREEENPFYNGIIQLYCKWKK